MQAFAELNEKGDRIEVHFHWDPQVKDAVKSIPGARFVPREKGGPFWQLPRDLTTARLLRERIGRGLELGEGIKEWGREAVRDQRKLMAIALRDDAPLEELKITSKLPTLAKWLRPYQRADVAFFGTTSALNLNEPRLGKTAETIALAYEADLEGGPQLVVAPQKALETVWRMEIERWTDDKVFTFSGDTPKADRDLMRKSVSKMGKRSEPFWLVTTADMIRRELPMFTEFEWNTFTVDEYHKTGMLRSVGNNDPKKNSKFILAVRQIKAKRRYAMSGTPIGGRAIKLWNGLNFIAPEVFTAKWTWANQWLDVAEDDRGHPIPGSIAQGREDDFQKAHQQYIVRRQRVEVLPQLPPKLLVPVWCDMSTKQRKQYNSFAEDLEIRIDEHRVRAANVLVEYTRLKQFANAYCDLEVTGEDEEGNIKYKVIPTFDSGKLPFLLERLAEDGIDSEQPVGTTQAIVASQFREYIEMVSRYLTDRGISNILLSGKTSKKESERAQRAFKSGNDNEGLRVCCMVTTMGVGLTLDNVTTVHLMDETWIPDDQEQLSDRAINTTLNHQVSVLTYRSRGTLEEDIYKVNLERAWTNRDVLDLRRMKLKGAA